MADSKCTARPSATAKAVGGHEEELIGWHGWPSHGGRFWVFIEDVTTEAGELDVTFCPSGTQGFPDLRRDAIEIEAAERLHILVASLADVLRSKEAAGREKDRLALPRLRRPLDRLREDV